MLPLDNAPGGQYDLNEFGFDPALIQQQLPDFFNGYITTILLQPKFCFVPTVSSLAFTNPQSFLFTSICGTAACNNPTQVADYFTPTTNQLHVSYTQENSDWILQRQNPTFTCLRVCPTNISISNPPYFCTASASYKLLNAPDGSTIQWSASPTGIVTPTTATGNSFNITKVQNGAVTITAAITNACSILPFTKPINAGAPPITITATNLGTCSNGGYQSWQLKVNESANGTNWRWTVDRLNTTTSDIYIDQPSSTVTFVDVKGGGVVKLTYTDLCGVVQTRTVTVYSNCPQTFTMAPNPADDGVIVSSEEPATGDRKTPGLFYAIKVTDQLGTLRKNLPIQNGCYLRKNLGSRPECRHVPRVYLQWSTVEQSATYY